MGKIKLFFLSILLLIMSGCGGGDNGSNVEFSPSMDISDMRVVKDGSGNIVNLIGKITLKESENYFSDVTFSDISAYTDGCPVTKTTVTPDKLNSGQTGEFNIELGSGCHAIYSITFKGTEEGKYVDTNVKTKTDTFSLSKAIVISSTPTDATDATGGTTTTTTTSGTEETVNVINTEVNTSVLVGNLVIDPKSIEIINSSEQHTFTIQAIDKNGKDVVAGAIIKPLPLVDENGNVLGYFNQNLYVTDGNGKAQIIYTAPSDISKIKGDYTMQFFVSQSDVNTTAVIKFNQNNANVAHIALIPNDISILEPKMTQQIKIIAVDKDYFPISGAEIIFGTMHDDSTILGDFNTKSVITNENGEAIITYTAPDNIDNLETNATALFKLKDNPDVNATLTARFENGLKNLDRIVVNPNNINVLAPNQTQEITILAIDKNNNPMKNVKIDVETLVDENNISYGKVDTYQITTDENGKAVVIYTAPDNINIDEDKSIVFKLDADNSINTKVNISFQNQTDVAKVIFDPSSIDVNQPNITQQIKILTVDKDNNPISALVSLSVPVDENNNSFGSLDTYQVRTNENGEAIVTYTSPTEISKVTGTQTITAKVVNTSIDNEIKINFNTDKPTHIVLDPKSIEVSDGVTKAIRITAFNDNNITVPGVKLTIKMPVLDNGLSVGKFNVYNLVTNENGEALVTYTAPENTVLLEGNKTVEIVADDVSSDLTLQFIAPSEKKVSEFYVLPSEPIRVTQDGQKEQYKLITLDENKRPIKATITVNKLITEDSDGNAIEFGTMDNYSVETDENGEAIVTYTAPDDISKLDGNKTITFKVEGSTLEKNSTLEFVQDSNVSNYKITLTTSKTSFAVDSKDSFTVNIVKQNNDKEYLDNAKVLDVNITSLSNLISFEGDERYEYNNSASKVVDFKAGRYSGIELVKVVARINDGEKNVTITNTFNLVISAGPISSISINYLNTEFDENTGLFVEKYAIHAVDKYSNPAKAGSKIYFGAINGWKLYADKNGTIELRDDNSTLFTTDRNLTQYDVNESDTVVVLPNNERVNEKYLGGWLIDSKDSDNNLTLIDKYLGSKTDRLSFVIGNEKRYDKCENSIKNIDFTSTDKTYEIDENGVAYITLKYDPYLVGKTVSLYANSKDVDTRVGSSVTKVLMGLGIEMEKNQFSFENTSSSDAYFKQKVQLYLKGILINGNKVPAQNVKIDPNFIQSDFSGLTAEAVEKGCIVTEIEESDCGGSSEFKVVVPANTKSCSVEWNNQIQKEYASTITETNITAQNSNIDKLVVEPVSEVISNAYQQELIKVIAIDSDGKVVPSATIEAKALVDGDVVYGSLSSYEITTNANGEAYVTYTAPSDIEDLLDTNKTITFSVKDADIEVNNTIVFKEGDNNDKVAKIVIDPDSFEVNSPIDTKVLKVTAVDSDGNVVEDAIIDIKALEKNGTSYGSMSSYSVLTNSNGEAYITYYAPENIAKVNGERNITFDVRGTDIENNVTVSFKAKASEINVLPSSMVVTQDKQTQIVTIVTTDSNGNVIPNTKVIAKLDSDYGLLNEYEITTDSNGRASVIYTAPESVKDLDGEDTQITFDIDGAEASTTISFNTNANNDVDHLLVTPTSFEKADIKTITIVAVDSDGKVVPNAVIKVKELKDSNGVLFGRMSSYSFATDANGEASVVFYSTENEIEGNQTITFDVDGTDVEENVTIIYPKKANAIAVLPEEIGITKANQNVEFSVFAVDDDGKIVPNTKIEIKSLVDGDEVYGQMDKYSGYTDENGEVRFIYTAPENIDNMKDKNITIYIPDSDIEKNVTIKVYKPSKLVLYPTALTITKANEQKNIKVIVTDDENRVVPNAEVVIEALVDDEKAYGFLDTHTLTTDKNGEAIVTFTAPENISNLSEENLTFYLNNTNVEENLTINFIKPEISAIALSPAHFVVEAGKTQTIKVITLADDNTTVASTKVTIDPLFDENGGLVGTFDKYSFITDENGEAYVTYTPIENTEIFEGNKSVRFITENNKTIDLTLQFVTPKEVAKIVVLPKYVKVTENNQEQEYKIITLDGANRPISADVEINKLLDENDNEYGTLDKYQVTTDAATGEAIVKYTAPDNIDDFEGNYSISFKTENIEEVNSTLEFVKEDSNATEYVIKLVAPASFAVDAKDSFSVKIVKKSDEDTYIDDEDVNDVNVSFVNKMVAFNEDRDEYLYEYNNSSSESIDIYSKTHSGIEFVDVNASIYDGEKNITISNRFKVVVISGPISAISINYLSTKYDSDNGVFIEKYAIHAVDRYSNPANAGSKIYVGAINGMKIMKDRNGTIGYDNDNEVTEFNVTDVNLTEANISEDDTLAVLANKDRLDGIYLGGWTIKELVDDNQTTLNEDYSGKTTNLLTYVIGDEKRYDSCSDSVRLIDFNSTDGSYEVNSQGIAYITAKYDPYLVGKTVTFYANSDSKERVGVAVKRILKGTGIVNPGSLVCEAGDDNTECELTFGFSLNNSSEDLQNTLLLGTFVKNDPNGECNITDESITTNCAGSYTVKVSVEKNSTCTVEWGNAIDYEY